MRAYGKIRILELMILELLMEKYRARATWVNHTDVNGRTVVFTATVQSPEFDLTVSYALPKVRIHNCGGDYLYPFAVNTTALLIDEIEAKRGVTSQ